MKELEDKLARYEKEKKELELRVEELTDFIENASIPLHWVDENGIIIWANQAELDLLNFTKEEYIGFPISDFHADQKIIQDILTRLTNDETLHNYPARLKCKDGTIKHVLVSSNVLRKDGKFVHTRCFSKDITDQVKEEERKTNLLLELEESEARFRMAVEANNLGTWDYSPLTDELYCSAECRDIHGLSPEAAISFEMFLEHMYPEDRDYVLQERQKVLDDLDGDGRYEVIYRIFRFDDHSLRWLKVQGKIYRDSEGQIIRFAGTALDITDIKQGEEKSARLAAIIDSTDDAIISKTLESIITSWNHSAERTFGYKADEMIGQSIYKLIPADRQEEEPRILSRLKKGERVEHFETKRLTKTGDLLDVSLTISPVKDLKGNIIGLSKIARDITERKQEEQRKNDFVAMVSHELKTPLTSITAYIQLLLAKAKKEGDSFTINALTRTEVQAKKMTLMIHDFLSLARLEEGKIRLHKELFELHPLVEEIAGDAQFLTEKHTIKLIDCDGVTLHADRDKIGQVLINLLSNAVKYSPAGGTITIGCEKQAGKVKIFVSDQGMGISPADQKRLFERFYRVSDDKLKMVSGFGIGLYLVSEILRYHDSKIEVKSQEGAGSTFHFYLAVADS